MSLLPAMIDQIEDANLPVAVYRTAVRIARRLDSNGQVIMAWEEYQQLTGCNHADAARRHLRTMGKAGLIDWRGGVTTVITWKIDGHLLSENRQLVSENAQLVSENRQLLRVDNNGESEQRAVDVGKRAATVGKQAVGARKQAATARSSHTRDLVGGWVDPSLLSTSKKNPPTHPPKKARDAPSAVSTGEQQLALDLLVDRDVGISFEVAEILARTMPCLDIYRVVDDWLPERRAGKVQPGALVDRIRRLVPSLEPRVALSTAFRDSDLYRRHELPDGVVLDAQAQNGRGYYSGYSNFDDDPPPDEDPLAWRAAANRAKLAGTTTGPEAAPP